MATDRVHGGRVVNAAADSQPGIYYVVLQLSRVSGIPLQSLNVMPGAGIGPLLRKPHSSDGSWLPHGVMLLGCFLYLGAMLL